MTVGIRREAGARLQNRVAWLLLAAASVLSPLSAAQGLDLLDPEKAFRISTQPLDERNVEVRFEIADGYYNDALPLARVQELLDAASPKK